MLVIQTIFVYVSIETRGDFGIPDGLRTLSKKYVCLTMCHTPGVAPRINCVFAVSTLQVPHAAHASPMPRDTPWPSRDMV